MYKDQIPIRCSKCGKPINTKKYKGRCKDCNTWKPRGKYIICEEDNEIWSTNSPFWRDFFKGE